MFMLFKKIHTEHLRHVVCRERRSLGGGGGQSVSPSETVAHQTDHHSRPANRLAFCRFFLLIYFHNSSVMIGNWIQNDLFLFFFFFISWRKNKINATHLSLICIHRLMTLRDNKIQNNGLLIKKRSGKAQKTESFSTGLVNLYLSEIK